MLLNVALKVNLSTFRQKALAAFLTATTKCVTASFGAHACAESVLAFAGACGLASIYGFLQGAWPFGLVEAAWLLVALHRWRRVRLRQRYER